MKNQRVFWGLLLLLGGIVLLVSKLGYMPDINVFSLIFSVFLVGVLIKSIFKMNFGGILFPLAFLCILYDDALGITAITPWTVLIAATLGTVGLSLIFNKRPSFKKEISWSTDDAETVYIENESNVKLKTSFGSSIKYINTDKFNQASINCEFGGMEVYFDNAVMETGTATVKLEVSFAGVELYVPRNWNIIDNTHVSFGSLEVGKRPPIVDGVMNTLILVGDISFAGVEVKFI